MLVGEWLNFRLNEADDALRNSLAQHWDGKDSPKGEHFLRLVECVFRVFLDIHDLHRAALEQGATHRGCPSGRAGSAFPQFQKFARQIMSGHRAARFTVVTE